MHSCETGDTSIASHVELFAAIDFCTSLPATIRICKRETLSATNMGSTPFTRVGASIFLWWIGERMHGVCIDTSTYI